MVKFGGNLKNHYGRVLKKFLGLRRFYREQFFMIMEEIIMVIRE